MEQTENQEIIPFTDEKDEVFSTCRALSRRCPNFYQLRQLKAELEAGLSLVQIDSDTEVEAEIERVRQELRGVCDSCALNTNQRQKEDVVPQVDLPSFRGKRSKDIERAAKALGFIVTKGNGRHGVHIETADGKFVAALPRHAKAINSFTGVEIVKNLQKLAS